MKFISLLGVALSFLSSLSVNGQPYIADMQGTKSVVSSSLRKVEDTLRTQFSKSGLTWPAKEIYIRSFKYDSQLEIWARNNDTMPFQLFKTYKVCAMAGAMGPKRIEGDFQVPEGFYYINEFNPRSEYHLSLKLNYPNESDLILSDEISPGGRIYIHGSCVTVGCIPLRNEQIEEVYLIAASARSSGQNFIPVHIFPVRFDNPKSMGYLYQTIKNDVELQRFETQLKEAYDYFNETKKLPLIGITPKGDYVVMY